MAEDLEMVNSKDHDILITLVSTVKSNHQTILEKVKDLHNDMSEVKDGTKDKLNDHELRISTIEKVHAQIDPESQVKIIQSNNEWIHDFKLTWKVVLGFSIGIASVISFILGFVASLVRIFIT